MSFNPIIPNYVAIASASYIQPSSSVGAFQMATIESNLEWNYHFANSQTRLNFQVYSSNGRYEAFIPETDTNKNTLINSFGPFRINLDKRGTPQPMYFAIAPAFYNADSTTGSFICQLRSYDEHGNSSIVEVGTLVTTSQPVVNTSQTWLWQSLTTVGAQYISASMNQSSSVLVTTFNQDGPYKLQTRTTKSLTTTDSFQTIGLAYFDVYFRVTSTSGSGVTSAAIFGVYGKEVNIIGDKWL
jgi:hypothetical protein